MFRLRGGVDLFIMNNLWLIRNTTCYVRRKMLETVVFFILVETEYELSTDAFFDEVCEFIQIEFIITICINFLNMIK
jgi:hypothetical protein